MTVSNDQQDRLGVDDPLDRCQDEGMPEMTCECGQLRLPGRECCGLHGPAWDDETAQALEHIEVKRQAAQALAAHFLANADDGNDEANSDLVAEMKRRMRDREC